MFESIYFCSTVLCHYVVCVSLLIYTQYAELKLSLSRMPAFIGINEANVCNLT